jgi:hypothetical protein
MIVKTLKELYSIFHKLEETFFDKPLEEPVILIQSTKRKILGTCSVHKVWDNKNDDKKSKYEITVVAESLNRPTEEIVETLLHEMIHLYCSLNDIKDTSNNFVYHNKKYKEEAEKRGLEVSHAKTIGHAITTLKPETIATIKSYGIDESAFEYYRKPFFGTPGKKVVYIKYECPECGIKLSTYKLLNLMCGDCKKQLEVRE